jgi:hypothetical protein
MRDTFESLNNVPGPGTYNPEILSSRGRNLCNNYLASAKLKNTLISLKTMHLIREFMKLNLLKMDRLIPLDRNSKIKLNLIHLDLGIMTLRII